MHLSIIVPVFNEEANIKELFSRLKLTLEKLPASHEIIFVNDGSTDNTYSILKELASGNTRVKFIELSRNFGHQIAVAAGIDYATGDAVISIDADLQDPPELIGDLHKKFNEGFDVVYAKRKTRKDKSILKKILYKLFYRILARISPTPIPLDTGDFRIISKRVANILKEMTEQQKFFRGQIAWIGFRQAFIEYDRDERQRGKPGYTYSKLFKLAFDGIVSFSNIPLRFATIAGFLVSGISFILILYALYSRFIMKMPPPQGWTSLMISILFIGGIQLLSIGIIGEYISRLSTNVRKRPLYIVKETNLSQNP